MKILKEELVCINEWKILQAFFEALDRWITHYNSNYLHSTLGYIPPEFF